MKRLSIFSINALITGLASFFAGILCSILIPTLSLVLVADFGANAIQVGIFFIGISVSSILFSHSFAGISDQLTSRLPLIVVPLLCGGVACFLFSYITSYILMMLVAVTLYGFSYVALPQIIAYTKEFADQSLEPDQVVIFNSLARAFYAIAWVAGPPLGYFVYQNYGFQQHVFYLGVAHIFIVVLLLCFFPRIKSTTKKNSLNNVVQYKSSLLNSVLAFCLLYGVNHSYMLSLPHYLNQYLEGGAKYAGLLMGTAAAIEVPVMLLAGWLSSRVSLLLLLQIGAGSACLLYAGMWHASSLWQIFLLQVFNAVFIGFIAGLGMSWLQYMLPTHPGVASSLYSNSANMGNVFGAALVAVFAQVLGYKDLYLVNILVSVVALGLLLFACKEKGAPSSEN